MPITFDHTPGSFKKLRNKALLQEQRTFQTPLENLQPFVTTILSAIEPIQSGRIVIDEIIFEPHYLSDLLTGHSIMVPPMSNTRDLHDWTLSCSEIVETQQLLVAVLRDKFDFMFAPTPGSFMIYADHDDYATFFSRKKSHLTRMVQALSRIGISPVEYWRWS